MLFYTFAKSSVLARLLFVLLDWGMLAKLYLEVLFPVKRWEAR
jgi:hypothetical protein